VLRGLLLVGVGRGLQGASAFASVRLATGILDPTEMGRLNLLQGVTSGFALLLVGPVASYMLAQALEWHLDGRLAGQLRRFGVFVLGATVVAAGCLLLIDAVAGIGVRIEPGWLVWLVAGSICFTTLNGTGTQIVNALGHRGRYVLLMNVTSWTGLALAVVATHYGDRSAEHWLHGLLFAQLGGACLVMLVLRGSGSGARPLSRREGGTRGFDVASVFRFSLPLTVVTALYWGQTQGYRFVLAGVAGEATVGLLAVGLAIAVTPMAMFEALFAEYYRPIFYREIAHGDAVARARAWNRYASVYFPSIVVVMVYVGGSGPYLARVLLADQFQDVAWLAGWGALFQAALMVFGAYTALAFACLDTRLLVRPAAYGAVVSLLGTAVLATWSPLAGASVALVVSMLVVVLDTALRLQRSLVLVYPWRRIGLACLVALPLGTALNLVHQVRPDPTLVEAVVVLAAGAVVMLAGQVIVLREWLTTQMRAGDGPVSPDDGVARSQSIWGVLARRFSR
jgi:O-antigen/teichoic acid export membrane protein